MATWNIFGYECSDEVNIMVISGAVKVIACELGMEKEITDEGIGNGLPSQATLTKMENSLASDARARDCLEIVEDGAYNTDLLTDHGNQKDQDHIVKNDHLGWIRRGEEYYCWSKYDMSTLLGNGGYWTSLSMCLML